MYPNLKGEMAKYDKTLEDLARATGRTVSTMSLKLSGKYGISLTEAIAIKEAIGTKMPLEELFSKEAA